MAPEHKWNETVFTTGMQARLTVNLLTKELAFELEGEPADPSIWFAILGHELLRVVADLEGTERALKTAREQRDLAEGKWRDFAAELREMTYAHSEETGARCRAEDDLAAERWDSERLRDDLNATQGLQNIAEQERERWEAAAGQLRGALVLYHNHSLTVGEPEEYSTLRAAELAAVEALADPDGARAAAEWAETRDEVAARLDGALRDHAAAEASQAKIAALEAQLAEARETLREAIEREEGIAETWRKEAAAIGNDAPGEMLRHRTSIQTVAGTLEQVAARLREDVGPLPGEEAKG